MSRILITGGAGFVGSHLADVLLAKTSTDLVVLADNFFLGHELNLEHLRDNARVQVVRVDISGVPALLHVVKKFDIDTIFSLAVVPLPTSLDYPEWTLQNNVGIAIATCEVARLRPELRVINVSSSEAYGSAQSIPMFENHRIAPSTPYASSKAASDLVFDSYAQTFGSSILTLRPFNMFGPRQNPGSYAGVIPTVIQRLRDNLPIVIDGSGEQTRDFTYVRESVRAMADLAQSWEGDRKVVNIGTGVETSINTLVQTLIKVTNAKNVEITHGPARTADVHRHCAGVERLSDLLGYTPEPISEGQLIETVNWYDARR